MGRFILDFYCAEAKLAIEIDGDVHAAPDQAPYDAARTAWLEERGYSVIRFQARDVENDLARVLEELRAKCEERRMNSQELPLSRSGGRRPPKGGEGLG
jgi:very-short-patch-repair endonuclease